MTHVAQLALLLSGLAGHGPAPAPPLEDATTAWGIAFRHVNGMSGALHLPEIMGPGAALFDYDGDGDLDLYVAQGGPLGPDEATPGARVSPPGGRLLRNDAGPEGRRAFTDVTAASGVRALEYGMGAATGDVDNDGDLDLYLTNLGPDRLWRNEGDGTFTDATAAAGLGDAGWGVSAAFFDYDGDGWLDLYLGRYVEVDLADPKPCYNPSSARDYCTPLVFPALPDRLYRNLGGGRFEDVSHAAGIDRQRGAALGVVAADFDGNGTLDVYVANDSMANFLWLNQGDGTFRDDAVLAGCAVSMEGAPQGSMGLDAADYDGDGDLDLVMTHLTGETNTLYVNDGQGWFEDRSIAMGMSGPSMAFTGFGTGLVDLDNDGWLDLFVANGSVNLARTLTRDDPFPLDQTNQLFLGSGRGFRDASAEGGPAMAVSEVSRGVAFGDVDNDGDADLVVANNNGPARLLLNGTGQDRAWIGLTVQDRYGRDALGAMVSVDCGDGTPRWRRVHTDGSYASASDPRVLVGCGDARGPATATVRWPGGREETWRGLPLGRYGTLTEGAGEGPAP